MNLEDMTDDQLLQRAAHALRLVETYPIGSIQRSIQWAVYEDAKAELDNRLLRHVIRRLRER